MSIITIIKMAKETTAFPCLALFMMIMLEAATTIFPNKQVLSNGGFDKTDVRELIDRELDA